MSKITKWFPGPTVGGDVMPWGDVIIEGKKWLICAGLTGRSFGQKQEDPELLERDDFESDDQAALSVCPRDIETQVVLILEKIKASLERAGTSFDNVFCVDYYIVRRLDFPRAWRAMKKWMDNECPEFFDKPRPAVLTNVHGLDHPDMLIEIRMWACVPE